MSNPHEDWDEYDWRDYASKVSHEQFLTTPEGKKWEKNRKREKAKENFFYFILILLGIIICIFLIGTGSHDSNPYRR